MITLLVLRFFGSIVGFALDLIPDALGVPSFLEDALAAMVNVFSSAMSLAVWIPIPIVVAGLMFRLAVLLGAISVKSLRVIASMVTGGGGSAG